jgi:hypothetical protein
MRRALIAAAVVWMSAVGTIDVLAQGPPGAAGAPAPLPLGWSTAPRPDGRHLPFPRNILQREARFGIDPRLMALPGGVLVLMALLGIVTLRLACRREPH